MTDLDTACDDVWSGSNGEELCEVAACSGCHFVLGAAVAFGIMGMARAIQLRTVLRGRVCSCCGGRDDFLLCGPCQHAVARDRSKVGP